MEKNDRSSIPPLFDFSAVWLQSYTQPFEFSRAMNHTEISKLEGLRTLSAFRASAFQSRSSTLPELQNQIQKLEDYLFHLHDLRAKSEEYWDKRMDALLNFYWTSPLAARTDFIRLPGIDLERAMALFMYVCAMREEAHLHMKEAIGKETESAWITELVRSLQKAAGVCAQIKVIFGEKEETDNLDFSNLPAEIVPVMVECMEKVCLAEAQSLLAYRAHEKGNSFPVVISLHVGASDLFEEASRLLRQNAGKFNYLSDKFRRFLALSCSLEQIRAYQQCAVEQRSQDNAGMAVAYCEKALNLLETCQVVAEDDEGWVMLVQQEQNCTSIQRKLFDEDRLNVLFQQISFDLKRLPAGKILVKRTNYQPTEKQPFL